VANADNTTARAFAPTIDLVFSSWLAGQESAPYYAAVASVPA
jgi:hypothetical protein